MLEEHKIISYILEGYSLENIQAIFFELVRETLEKENPQALEESILLKTNNILQENLSYLEELFNKHS